MADLGDLVRDSDLLPYVRCPYAWWLVANRQVSFVDTVDDLDKRLLREGREFHEIVRQAAAPVKIDRRDIRGLLASDRTVLNIPMGFYNESLLLGGRPDGIACAEGRLIPLEIKSHKDIQRIDRLELAFYWLLLDPYRSRDPGEPRGLLVLRRGEGFEQVDVPLREADLEEVQDLVNEIRQARRVGVRPRVCDCVVCSGAQQSAIDREIRQQKDLTMIVGIGRVRARALETVGYETWERLLDCDPIAVRSQLRELGCFVSVAEVERWKHHAHSYRKEQPVYFGGRYPLGGPFIALDLEYENSGHIWLIGIGVTGKRRPRYELLWADTAKAERRNVQRLLEVLAEHPTLPVVTWAGSSADLPKLRDAAARLGLGSTLAELEARHLDLYAEARVSLRLPATRLGLKHVAEHFGLASRTEVTGGLQAQMLYASYRGTRGARAKRKLRNQLLRYNREDLRMLMKVADRMRAISAAQLATAEVTPQD